LRAKARRVPEEALLSAAHLDNAFEFVGPVRRISALRANGDAREGPGRLQRGVPPCARRVGASGESGRMRPEFGLGQAE
jgi:hypothetical protein